MRFKVEFDCDNDTFQPDAAYAVAEALRDVATRVARDGAENGSVRDADGNIIGHFTIVRD